MKQEKFSGDWRNRQRNAILLVMITILILYIAIPIYGVIQDAKEGGTVFVIEGSDTDEDLIDKIIDFMFQSDEVKVQSTYIVDLKGIVINSDKTPYANGIVELRSKPRYTRTDKDGYFIFRSVEAGNHKINVLDESGNILATCNVDLSTVKHTDRLVTTSFSDNTYRINVSVNVQVLEIKITLKTDEDGNVQGIGDLEVIKADTAPLDQTDGSAPGQTDLEDPQQPDDGGAGEPDETDGEPEPPVPDETGSSGGGGGGGGSHPNPFLFNVYDSSVASFGSTAAAQVDIFGKEKLIAPGMKGSSRFTVDNTRNDYRSLYTIDFTKSDTLPAGSKIPMVFRLKAGNSYVAGDANTWLTASQLHQDTKIAGNSKTVYTLEWYWPESEKDGYYAKLDWNKNYSCTLRIEVTAQME